MALVQEGGSRRVWVLGCRASLVAHSPRERGEAEAVPAPRPPVPCTRSRLSRPPGLQCWSSTPSCLRRSCCVSAALWASSCPGTCRPRRGGVAARAWASGALSPAGKRGRPQPTRPAPLACTGAGLLAPGCSRGRRKGWQVAGAGLRADAFPQDVCGGSRWVLRARGTSGPKAALDQGAPFRQKPHRPHRLPRRGLSPGWPRPCPEGAQLHHLLSTKALPPPCRPCAALAGFWGPVPRGSSCLLRAACMSCLWSHSWTAVVALWGSKQLPEATGQAEEADALGPREPERQ